jgi:hypothetical protein
MPKLFGLRKKEQGKPEIKMDSMP